MCRHYPVCIDYVCPRAGRMVSAPTTRKEVAGCIRMPDMSVASELVKRHIETLVADNAQWQTLLADDVVWELPFAPSLGHPGKVVGREACIRHAGWFLQTVTDFRFFDLRVYE